jgi:hypothetical protein
MKIPAHGKPKDQIKSELEAFSARDAKWRDGKTLGYIYDAGPEVEEIAKWAYMRYLTENALAPATFPSLMQIENELVAMAAAHLGDVSGVVGNFTSGGTESIFLALKTARDWARAEKGIDRPKLVMPVSGHATANKAASYLGIEVVRTALGPDLRADMTAYFRALGAMCDRMLPAFAVALDMPEDFFAPYFANEGHANLRFLHYPPQQDMSENTFGTAPHTDNQIVAGSGTAWVLSVFKSA